MGSPTKDSRLFEAVHSLFWQQGSGERRAGPRHLYECKQLVAPYEGGPLPVQGDFSWVDCKNLSSRGFAFFLPEPPRTEHVVVALGRAPFIFLVARIEYFDREGEQYVCGCQFQKRISRVAGPEGVATKQLPAKLDRRLLDATIKEAPASKRQQGPSSSRPSAPPRK
jgi:hypothetical protein